MANASLQIGNGNWAIKENDLLGYSKSGTRFLPIPITMTRSTLGTRVNPSGLIENVELLDDELVTNGDFATDSDWSKGSNWTISGGSATSDGVNATSNLSQVITSFSGKTFLVEGNASNVSQGFAYVSLGGSDLQIVVNSSGAFKHYVTISSGNSTLFISGRNNFIGSIDNVSVKEVTRDGLARVDYTDGTGSLLVEPQRTNLVTYSQDFSNSYWTKSGASVTSGFTSPDGTNNAYKLVEGTNNGGHTVYKLNVSISSGVNYTYSVFVKGTERVLQMVISSSFSSNFCNFDLSDGTIGSNSGLVDSNITSFSNGWYRCDITALSNGTSAHLELILAESKTSSRYTTYQGDGSSGVEIYGAQLEAGSYPTSYIKTQGSTVTRNKDEYTKTGISDKINSDEGVLFVEMAALANDGNTRYLSLNDGTSSNRVTILYYSGNNNIRTIISSGGSNYVDKNTGVTSALDFHKIAVKWKENDFALWVDGAERKTDTSGLAPTGLNTLSFDQLGFDNLFGKVRQLQVFKTALSDSELETLTTI